MKITETEAINIALNYWQSKNILLEKDSKIKCLIIKSLYSKPDVSGWRVVAKVDLTEEKIRTAKWFKCLPEEVGIDGGDLAVVEVDEEGNVYIVPMM